MKVTARVKGHRQDPQLSSRTNTNKHTHKYVDVLIGAAARGAGEATAAVLRPRSLSLMTAIKSAAIKIDLKRKK